MMEPRASRPRTALAAIESCRGAASRWACMVAPVIPGLTDHEMPAHPRGRRGGGGAFRRLQPCCACPTAVADLFERWLEQHFPDRKDKVLSRIRALRGGKLNDPRFGSRMRGEGVFAETIERLYDIACKKAGIALGNKWKLSTAAFRRPGDSQAGLLRLNQRHWSWCRMRTCGRGLGIRSLTA